VSISSENPVSIEREPPPLDTGARIGRYLIIERVGSGAMGVVYGAYDPELDRKIALKLLKGRELGQEDAARARLLREAKAMARLAHQNVIAVHDVGVVDGQVFLAMEFLGGGTLKSWLAARPRRWREVLDVFIAAGRGLAAAHAAGLVHRDFKPENVLLDKEGRPRVVDFGLAREATAAPDGSGAVTLAAAERSGSHLETLTRTGAIMGTPAYMAPEQITGEPTDERTDQFSFCVALYEALYGERPFRGESLLRLLHNVTEGELEPTPGDREVPAWIRRALLRGLRPDPAQRWASMAPLITALEDDPAARHRRRLLAGTAVALVLASVVAVVQVVDHRRQALEREIGRHLHDAARAAESGRAKAADLRERRRRSFEAFDAVDRARGEALWQQAQALVPAAAAAFQRAERAYETALVLDPARAEPRRELADLLYQHVLWARELHRDEQAQALTAALAAQDEDGRRGAALRRQGTLMLRTAPVTASIALARYQEDHATARRVAESVPVELASGVAATLPPGSYRLIARAPGHAEVVHVFELESGERHEIDLRLPRPAAVPDGFVYVPAGEFWFGDADENLRTKFLDTVPIHRRHTDAFLIARHETTYREWVEFLNALPSGERARHAPHVSGMVGGSLRLSPEEAGWQIAFRATSQRYTAREGEPILYLGRNRRARQDWLDFPVGGIAPADVERYVRWLRETGRVPRARFCTELEWERAARGGDDRAYPHGDDLAPDDANFDVTYGRVDSAVGPDAVGAHPSSRSPFGVDDMAGNVLELVRSSLTPQGFVIRGGGYFFNAATCRLTNRTAVWSTYRDVTSGIRVCASVEETP
jgi:formylglycine-generating enzyme required for sulfatase activity/tRNA A-37 threonylcarbamoyl transferase component Bud32